MQHIAVCVKAVPDPRMADRIRIDPATKSLPRLDLPLVVNPLDRHALEVALQQKDRSGAHITVISMGPPAAGDIVRECLALGADEGLLLSDPAFAGADTLATAYTLAKAIEKIGAVDVVLCGRASSDGSTEWVGPELATFLHMPVVTMVREFVQTESASWKVKADLEHGYRLVQVELPAVFTVTQDVNRPRTLGFSGIIKARKRTITTWKVQDLGVPEDCVGLRGSPTIVSELSRVDTRRTCHMVDGTLEEKAEFIIAQLVRAGVLR